ncbi:MAG: helix-turn-helix domain-containing protein, partial [Sphingomonadales bacterium]|nr:helix-turn-helix domain-containing protein [Sphingomonadales bacterium]
MKQTMLTVKQAAALLGYSEAAVRKLVQTGKLAAVRVGGGQRAAVLLIAPAEVARYRDTPRAPGGRPRGGAATVRVGVEVGAGGANRTRLAIGRAAWAAIGSPARIMVLPGPRLAPAGNGAGYALATGAGAPRCLVGGAMADLLAPGLYDLDAHGWLTPRRERGEP